MASDGSAPAPGLGQVTNDGVGVGADDAHTKPTFMHLPMRLRNPRGVGLSHQGARTSNSVHLPEVHNSAEKEESNSVVQGGHRNTFQDDNSGSRFAHLPQHIHDPRGARVSRPTEEVNVDPASVNQVESATPEENQVRFSHLPRLHNPRGVHAVKQIQEKMSQESGRQAGDEGDKN
ncbi:hypothetical protein KC19_3G233200 [Ceratodon purpureus]|uniref:Uncharacterized protein n=1 Tax=Ceratodon purpureus TaxID=3225 RepID=A0A8T0IQW2_CERPU|nr:hypothetical protein KC19_3G233200 [Ceratodon purpureus]